MRCVLSKAAAQTKISVPLRSKYSFRERSFDKHGVGRGSRPGTTCDYTQCSVLRSLQLLHVRLSQVWMPDRAGVRNNGSYNLIVQHHSVFFCVPERCCRQSFHRVQLRIVSGINILRVLVKGSTTSNSDAKYDLVCINRNRLFLLWSVGVNLCSSKKSMTSVREDLGHSADIRLLVSHFSNYFTLIYS